MGKGKRQIASDLDIDWVFVTVFFVLSPLCYILFVNNGGCERPLLVTLYVAKANECLMAYRLGDEKGQKETGRSV